SEDPEAPGQLIEADAGAAEHSVARPDRTAPVESVVEAELDRVDPLFDVRINSRKGWENKCVAFRAEEQEIILELGRPVVRERILDASPAGPTPFGFAGRVLGLSPSDNAERRGVAHPRAAGLQIE